MTETAKEAAKRLAAGPIADGFIPEALHRYTDAGGEPIYWRIRAKHADGRKWIRPMKLNGHGYELGEPEFPNGKPLYRLHDIARRSEESVWVVEGEKPADALAKLGVLATTSGSATSAGAADWTPVAGRSCVLWRDNDDPGKSYAGEVAARLLELGCDVSAIDVDALSLPVSGDAVDWLKTAQNGSRDALEALPRLRAQPPPSSAPEGDLASVELRCAADIPAEPVTWLWEGWLAEGKLHILAGPPGAGKTTLTMGIAATTTSGGRWPDGRWAEVGSVAIWSGEDAPSDTLVPRLMANGADLSRCHFVGPVVDGAIRRPFDPSKDIDLLALQLARIPDLRVLIVDPVVSAISGDAHKSNDVRRGLQPLCDFAERSGVAIIGISHFSKGTAGKDPVERVTGSVAFGAAPRVVLGAAKRDDDQGGGRILVRAKSNIGPDDGGFVYDLELVDLPKGIQTTRIVWKEVLEGSARSLLASAENTDDAETRSDLAAAKDFLTSLLNDGPVASKLIRRDAEDAGHSWATIRRAQAELGVEARKVSMKEGWVWELVRTAAPKMLNSPEDAQAGKVNTFKEGAHLRKDAQPLNVSAFGNDEHLRHVDPSDGEVF